MKRIGLFIAVIFTLSIAVSHAYDTVHVYMNGKVDSVSGNIITIDGSQYKIDAKCRFAIVYQENDIFHEKPAQRSDIRSGDSVSAKKIANTLSEITIERWKQ
jgi:hypothetical protein